MPSSINRQSNNLSVCAKLLDQDKWNLKRVQDIRVEVHARSKIFYDQLNVIDQASSMQFLRFHKKDSSVGADSGGFGLAVFVMPNVRAKLPAEVCVACPRKEDSPLALERASNARRSGSA